MLNYCITINILLMITRTSIKFGLAAALTFLALGSVTGTDENSNVYSAAEVQAAILAADVQSRRQQIDALRQAGNSAAVLEYLRTLNTTPLANSAGQAYLVHYGLMGLADLEASAHARELLHPWLSVPVSIRIWQQDGHYRLPIEAFDPGAAARFTLGRWNQAAWSRRVSDDLERGSTAFLAAWVAADDAAGGGLLPGGILDGLASVRTELLPPLRRPLLARLVRGERVGAVAAMVATQTGDLELATAVIRHAGTEDALRLLEDARGAFDSNQRFQLLREAGGRNDLGSAAMYGMGELDGTRARRYLLARLGSDDMGTSAAAALARRADPALIQEFAALVRRSDSPRARERAVLALQLAPDALAEPTLRRLARDRRVPSDLQARIARQLP